MDGTSDSNAKDVAKGEAKEAFTTTTPATGAETSASSPVDVVRGWVKGVVAVTSLLTELAVIRQICGLLLAVHPAGHQTLRP